MESGVKHFYYPILEQGMNNYWKSSTETGEWHFVQKTRDIQAKQSKLPFMPRLLNNIISIV